MPRVGYTAKLLGVLVLLALSTILLLQNWGHVHVSLLLWEVRIRQVWALLGALLLGALLSWLVANLRQEASRLRSQWPRR